MCEHVVLDKPALCICTHAKYAAFAKLAQEDDQIADFGVRTLYTTAKHEEVCNCFNYTAKSTWPKQGLMLLADLPLCPHRVDDVDIDIAGSAEVSVLVIKGQAVLVNPVQCPRSIVLDVCGCDTTILMD